MDEGLREKSRQVSSRRAGKQSGHLLESCGSNDHTMCSRWGRCEYTVLGVNRRKVGRGQRPKSRGMRCYRGRGMACGRGRCLVCSGSGGTNLFGRRLQLFFSPLGLDLRTFVSQIRKAECKTNLFVAHSQEFKLFYWEAE